MNTSVGLGYGRLAMRHLRRFGKARLHFRVEAQGRRNARHLNGVGRSDFTLDERAGWSRFDIRPVPELASTFSKLQDLAQAWMHDAESRRSGGFPVDLLLASDLRTHPEILQFALHDQFLVPASSYLRQVPRLAHLGLLWSPKNSTVSGSQKFHYDHRDTRQVKIFVNLADVTEEQGPLFFLPADASSRFNARVGYTQERVEDEAVYAACPQEQLISNIGEAGTGVMVDTSRCLHYGSRRNADDRLILMINYVRANCVKPASGSRSVDPVRDEFSRSLFKDDPVRQYALTVPPS